MREIEMEHSRNNQADKQKTECSKKHDSCKCKSNRGDDTSECNFAEKPQKVEELEKSLAELNEKLLVAVAETENTRRRCVKDVEDAVRFGATSLAKDVVMFVDNLERAVNSCETDDFSGKTKGFFDGVKLLLEEALRTLELHGIKKVETDGQAFNPEVHQAVSEAKAEDPVQRGRVVSTFQTGYTINGRLLRAAMVVVAR